MRKSVVAGIILAAGLLIVAGLFLFDQGSPVSPVEVRHDVDQGLPREQRVPGSSRGGVVEGDSRPASLTRPIAPRPFVEIDDPATTRPTQDDSLRVLVVEEGSGLPVPGAEVAWRDSALDAAQTSGPYSTASPLIADFDHAAQRTTADARGIAVIRTSERLGVAARRGDLFGLRTFTTAPRGEIRISVSPGPLVAARVVAASGAPVPGVPVLFTIEAKKGRTSSSSYRSVVSRSPDGLAIAQQAGARSEEFQGEGIEIVVGLEGAPDKDRVRVPLAKLKDGPITLVVPMAGHVVVKVIDPVGAPITEPAQVTLTAARKPPARGSTTLRATAEAGTADFPFVPAGVSLTVSASTGAFDSIIDQKVGELLTPGSDLTVEVRFVQKRPVVIGRAIDESGRALARRTLQVEAVHAQGAALLPAPMRVETDGQGGFKLVFDRQIFREPGGSLELEIRNGEVVERSGAVDAPKFSEMEDMPLGDVRLVPPVPLASGVVVDELDAPLEGALVMTERLRSSRGASATSGRSLSTAGMRTRTDSSGQFQIPTPPRTRVSIISFGLKAELEGYICTDAPTGLKPGAKDVKIVMRGGGAIEGQLLLPDPAPVRKLEVLVVRPVASDGAPAVHRFEDCIDSDGRFRLTGLVPGLVTVAIHMSGAKENLAVLFEVTIPRGRTADDPRLSPIDLREHPALRR